MLAKKHFSKIQTVSVAVSALVLASLPFCVQAETVKIGALVSGQVSKVWLDRDGSKYNFANRRFDQIRSKMLIKPVQEWMGPATVSRLYMAALPWLALEAGIHWPTDPREQRRLMAHKLQPDVPPELDEGAALEALSVGLANDGVTLEQWHAERGRDWEAVLEQRAQEKRRKRELAAKYDLDESDLDEPSPQPADQEQDDERNAHRGRSR